MIRIINAGVAKENEYGYQEIKSSSELFLSEEDLNEFAANGIAPVNWRKRSERTSIIPQKSFTVDQILHILDETLPYDVQARKTLVEYYGLDVSMNDLTAQHIVDNVDIETNESVNALFELINLFPTTTYGFQVFKNNFIVKKAKGFSLFGTTKEGEMKFVGVWFINGKPVIVVDDVISEYSDIMDIQYEPSPLLSAVQSFESGSIFRILGRVDLRKLIVPGKLTNAWIEKAMKMVGLSRGGRSLDSALENVFEELNNIASSVKIGKSVYFLLTDEYVKQSEILLTAPNLSFHDAVAYMARRHGAVVFGNSNPMFDESTLKDGGVWNIAVLKE